MMNNPIKVTDMDEMIDNQQRQSARPETGRIGSRARRHKAAATDSPGQSKKELKGQERRTLLLDAAEELFSQHGFYGVTVRNVADAVGVDSALIHYYFGTKRELFDAVLTRRAEPINAARLASMERYAAEQGDAVTVEGAVRAFLQPIFDVNRRGEPGWKNFSALVALVNNSRGWGGETMSRHFDPVIHRLLDLIARALPGARREDLYWGYQMLSGSLLIIQAATGRLELLSGGLCRSDDVDAYAERMIRYAAAGFREIHAYSREIARPID